MAIHEIADVEHFDRQCDSFPDVQSICNSSSAFVLPVFFCLGLLYSTPPSLPVVHLIFPPFYLLSVVPFSSLPLSFILNPLHFFPLPLPCLLFTKSIPTFSHCPPWTPPLSLSPPQAVWGVSCVCRPAGPDPHVLQRERWKNPSLLQHSGALPTVCQQCQTGGCLLTQGCVSFIALCISHKHNLICFTKAMLCSSVSHVWEWYKITSTV